MTYSKAMIRSRPGALGSWIDDFINFIKTQKPDPSDNVTQTATGGTSTSAADFTSVGGVCKPQNFPALDAVREFQRQLNRVAQVKKLAKTTVDGSIGAGTLGLFRQVQSSSSGSVMGDPSTCMGVAPDVDVLAAQVKDLADTLGAPATVSAPLTLTSAPALSARRVSRSVPTASGSANCSPENPATKRPPPCPLR